MGPACKIQDGGTKMGFLQFLPLYWFEIHPIEFYGEKKHTAKILSIYLSELGKRPEIILQKKFVWNGHLVRSSVSLPEILRFVYIYPLKWSPTFETSVRGTKNKVCYKDIIDFLLTFAGNWVKMKAYIIMVENTC